MSLELFVHDIMRNLSKFYGVSKFEFEDNIFYFKSHLCIQKNKV